MSPTDPTPLRSFASLPADPSTPVTVEYDCRGRRQAKTFDDAYERGDFYAAKFRAGKGPVSLRHSDPGRRRGPPPFGGLPGEAEVVGRIGALHAGGLSLQGIADALNEEKALTRMGAALVEDDGENRAGPARRRLGSSFTQPWLYP